MLYNEETISFNSEDDGYELDDYSEKLFNKVVSYEMAMTGATKLNIDFNGHLGHSPLKLKITVSYDDGNNLVIQEKGMIGLMLAYAREISLKSALKALVLYPFSENTRSDAKHTFRAICLQGIPKKDFN